MTSALIAPLFEPRLRKQIDRALIFSVVALMAVSLYAIYFATAAQPGGGLKYALRQGVFFIIGLILMVVVAAQDYSKFTRYAPFLYIGNALLLLAVRVLSPEINGARRWIPLPIPGMDFKLQPSEFAKVIIILTLAAYLARLGPSIREFPNLIKTLLHVALPVILIQLQPDLGTSLVLLAIWFGMVFLAGADWRHLVGMILVGALLFGVAWQTNLLKPYQKDRIYTFINPMNDPKGDGYHVLQSMTAIGGGQVSGQGLGHGVQTNGQFIPENHTDFIFTVIGEETGFVGAAILLATYALLLARGIATVAESEDVLGRLIAVGVVTLFAFHIVVNMGMTLGIMPVVGVPLPLISYGGSAAWSMMVALGLLLGIHMRRHKILF